MTRAMFMSLIGAALLLAVPALGQNSRDARTSKPAPKVGEEAPQFKLTSLDGKEEFDLAAWKGKKPVVLFFGSYT